jgi:hypothetical protein
MNQYRCETCKNLNCQRHGIHNLYPRECDLVTDAVGCASWGDGKGVLKGSKGSNGQLQYPIHIDEQYRICSQSERDKVIKDLESEINRVSLTGFTKYTYRKWILDLIRKQAGET